jgi:hypothetical protein
LGCRERPQPPEESATETAPVDRPALALPRTVRLLDLAHDSDLDHGGLVLELGEPGAEAAGDFSLQPVPAFPRVTHDGSNYVRVDQRQATFAFWVGAPLDVRSISALVRAGGSDRALVTIDDRRIGTLRAPADSDVVSFKTRDLVLQPGPHRLSLSLSGRADQPRSLDLSWVRLGTSDTLDDDLPPARRDLVREVAIGSDQRPAIVLRNGGAFRIPLWIPKAARIRAAVGLWGSGEGTAEIAVYSAGQRVLLHTSSLDEGASVQHWRPIDLDLAAYAEQAVELELRASGVSSGARLAFANPELTLPEMPGGPVPKARRAIVLVLSGLLREHRPSTMADFGLPTLASFSRTATFYPEYRNPTTSSLGIVASLLTGQEPWQHGIGEESDRLPQSRPTLAEALAASGGDAGFFTGVPLSFEGFGLARGFERYVSISPAEDRGATDPIEEAQAWLGAQQGHTGSLLSIVHLRAAHPPFDIDRDRARTLPPKEYGGDLDARRAAIQLSEIRARRPVARQQMPEEDWQRLESLRRAALLDLDARLSRFFTWLTSSFNDDGTLLVVMGELPAGERPHIPYENHAPLTEEYLRTLLLVRHPGGHLAAASVPGVFTTTDLTHTLARSLGVELVEPNTEAIDLAHPQASTAAGRRLHIAYREGSYSALLGQMLLFGEVGRLPSLCNSTLDPSCLENRRDQQQTLLRAMWGTIERRIGPGLEHRPAAESREPEERLDHALEVWGAPP